MIRTRNSFYLFPVLLLIVLYGCRKDPPVLTEGQTNWQRESVRVRSSSFNSAGSYNPFLTEGFIHHQPVKRIIVNNTAGSNDLLVGLYESCPVYCGDWLKITNGFNAHFIQDFVQTDSNTVYYSTRDHFMDSKIYCSTNGGSNWNVILTGYSGLIRFRNDTTMLVDKYCFHRQGSGQWSIADTLPLVGTVNALVWLNSDECLIATSAGITQYNMSTQQAVVVNSTINLRRMERVDGGVLIGISDDQLLVRSTDNGANWQTSFDPGTLLINTTDDYVTYDVKSLRDGQTLFATVGFYKYYYDEPGNGFLSAHPSQKVQGLILKSTDAGQTWNLNHYSEYLHFLNLDVFDENHIIAHCFDEESPDQRTVFYAYTTTKGE